LRGEGPLADPLRDQRLRLDFFVLGLAYQGFRCLQLRLKSGGVHTRQHVAGLDHVSFFDEDEGNPARELGGDFGLLRFEAPVGLGDPRRKRAQLLLPPVPGARTASRDEASEYQQPNAHSRLS